MLYFYHITNANAPIKQKPERSSAYPIIDLNTAVERVKKLHDNLGVGPYNRETVARGVGYTGLNGKSQRVVAALVHYGLLTRKGNVYESSVLAKQIIFPRDEKDPVNAIMEAVNKPKLYDTLIQKYANLALPSQLNNILVIDYKINKKVADEVVKNFELSLEYAGLLENGTVLVNASQNIPQSNENNAKRAIFAEDLNHNSESIKVEKKESIISSEAFYETPILPSGIQIKFPISLTTHFTLGDFANEIKNLEVRAQSFLATQKKEQE